MAGRPHKFTNKTIDLLLTAIRAGLPYHLAAEAAGIHYDTFNEWQQGRFPRGADKELKAEFSEELTRARASGALRLLGIINKAAPSDWRAAAWILERRFPEHFGKQLLEVTGADGGPLQVEISTLQQVILSALEDDPEARVRVAEALEAASTHDRAA